MHHTQIHLMKSIIFLILFSFLHSINSLGSSSTIAVVSSTRSLCGIVSSEPTRRIECLSNGRKFLIQPNISYDSIAGGSNFFCGLNSGGTMIICWDSSKSKGMFFPKRIYYNSIVTLKDISVGDDHVCAIVSGTNKLKCWRGRGMNPVSSYSYRFKSISSGSGFSCGVVIDKVKCWGTNSVLAHEIQGQFGNLSMSSLVAGSRHVCGFSSDDNLVCKGSNVYGQLDIPMRESFSQVALGFDFTCGVRRSNRTVVCWGSNKSRTRTSFEVITAGSDFVCGLSSASLSVMCWGRGWPNVTSYHEPLSSILPGKCVQSPCPCGVFPQSEMLCSNKGMICNPCDTQSPNPSPNPPSGASKNHKNDSPTFVILGSIGVLAGVCSICYFWYIRVCCGRKKVHNSVQPQINSPPSRSLIIRQCSRAIRRQRSGTSSTKHHDTRAEEFTFSDLAAATENFSEENKIGAGSFGVVYRGKLVDGRHVAIKRGETNPKAKKFQEKQSAFDSELLFLSRLHHKHLVRLVGFCNERDERLLVYEFMKNGALYDHLHDSKNVGKDHSLVNSWKLRIAIALDAARGIEYLHNYAVPPIIHRDIKSSNILLDSGWTARVSDFGLSLMGPETGRDFRPSKAAGTVGYIDPEYYGLNVLTAKSDVYGLGVVLLELLTGKRAIFKDEINGGDPMSVVDYSVPFILAGELVKILDERVGQPALNESEGLELVAYTAMHCVSLEGKDRPSMSDIVANLERALALCDDSHGSISSISLSVGSG